MLKMMNDPNDLAVHMMTMTLMESFFSGFFENKNLENYANYKMKWPIVRTLEYHNNKLIGREKYLIISKCRTR